MTSFSLVKAKQTVSHYPTAEMIRKISCNEKKIVNINLFSLKVLGRVNISNVLL